MPLGLPGHPKKNAYLAGWLYRSQYLINAAITLVYVARMPSVERLPAIFSPSLTLSFITQQTLASSNSIVNPVKTFTPIFHRYCYSHNIKKGVS
jgi:hypothetical protein